MLRNVPMSLSSKPIFLQPVSQQGMNLDCAHSKATLQETLFMKRPSQPSLHTAHEEPLF